MIDVVERQKRIAALIVETFELTGHVLVVKFNDDVHSQHYGRVTGCDIAPGRPDLFPVPGHKP